MLAGRVEEQRLGRQTEFAGRYRRAEIVYTAKTERFDRSFAVVAVGVRAASYDLAEKFFEFFFIFDYFIYHVAVGYLLEKTVRVGMYRDLHTVAFVEINHLVLVQTAGFRVLITRETAGVDIESAFYAVLFHNFDEAAVKHYAVVVTERQGFGKSARESYYHFHRSSPCMSKNLML